MVSGSEGVALVDSGEDVVSVDWEPAEPGSEDTAVVSVVGVGLNGPRLLTFVKIKGLAYWKQNSTRAPMHKMS